MALHPPKMHPWRREFPFFAKGEMKAFLDSAASAQKPASVLEAMDDFARSHYANIHRGVHTLTEESTAAYEAARAKTAAFIGADRPETVVFTRGTTEGINLVAQSLVEGRLLQKGATIVATALEHHSNFLPWSYAAARLGGRLEVAPITPQGEVDWVSLEALLKEGNVGLLALTAASNVLGTLPPLREIVALAHRHGAMVCVDGAQLVPHRRVNVAELDADFFAFSGHKLYGPTGIGALYIKRELAIQMPPWQLGGGMVHRVSADFSQTTFAPPPHRFEAGTPPIVEAVGLGAALDFVEALGFEKIAAHEQALTKTLLEELRAVPGLTLYGSPKERVGVVAFNLEGLHPHDVGSVLSAQGVAVRVGHHCAQPLMAALGLQGCVRASVGLYNTPADIAALIKGLNMAQKKLA